MMKIIRPKYIITQMRAITQKAIERQIFSWSGFRLGNWVE
jgi:hypothetical protein